MFRNSIKEELLEDSSFGNFAQEYITDCALYAIAAFQQYMNNVSEIWDETKYTSPPVLFEVFNFDEEHFIATTGVLFKQDGSKRHMTPVRIRALPHSNQKQCAANFMDCINESYSDLYNEMLQTVWRKSLVSRIAPGLRSGDKLSLLGEQVQINFARINDTGVFVFGSGEINKSNITNRFISIINDCGSFGFFPCASICGNDILFVLQRYYSSSFHIPVMNDFHDMNSLGVCVNSFHFPIRIDEQAIAEEMLTELSEPYRDPIDAMTFAFCVKSLCHIRHSALSPEIDATEGNAEEIIRTLSRFTTEGSIFSDIPGITDFLKRGLRLLEKMKRDIFMNQIEIERPPDVEPSDYYDSTISSFSVSGSLRTASESAKRIMMNVSSKSTSNTSGEIKKTEYTKLFERIAQRDPEIAQLFRVARFNLARAKRRQRVYESDKRQFLRSILPRSDKDIMFHPSMIKFRQGSQISGTSAIRVHDNDRLYNLISRYTHSVGNVGNGTTAMMFAELAKFAPVPKGARRRIIKDVLRYYESENSLPDCAILNCRREQDGSYQGLIKKMTAIESLRQSIFAVRAKKELLSGASGMAKCGFDVSFEDDSIVLKKVFNSFRFLDRFIVPITVDIILKRNKSRDTIIMKGAAFGRSSGNWHPHVSNGEFCLGSFKDTLKQCIDLNEPEFLMDAVAGVMNCYNPESPYNRISNLSWQSVMDTKTGEWISHAKMVEIYSKEMS